MTGQQPSTPAPKPGAATNIANLIWQVADQIRGVYFPDEYGRVILPMTILRRLDAVMEGHRDTMRRLAESIDNPDRLSREVKKATGLPFYNTSKFDFAGLLPDPENVGANLTDYINSFSPNIDVFERFDFGREIVKLAEKERLYLVVKQFADPEKVDLHPDRVPNAQMGDLFEHLIYKFAEASNKQAGEHYTPRDAIRLMVDLLFAEDGAALTQPGVIRSVYDPTAGTGGMLSVAEEHLLAQNPDAAMVMYGQELNDQSYAICKADMILKGQDASNIQLGDTLASDKHAGRTFDYCLSNPPYGIDWKSSEKAVKAERAATGADGRFGPGLPKISDGQMLFLSHLAHKMRPARDGGGRAGIVLNGSALFNGAAESGESEIRRWLLENDLVDAIVGLPESMFYNTGIATYIWILDNTKQPERRGKVQLIDATSFYEKMRRNLGDKSRQISDTDRDRIVRIYNDFNDQAPENADFSCVLPVEAFGYYTVTVEQPLHGDDGQPVTDRKGNFKPDPKRRDTEKVPMALDGTDADDTIAAYIDSEVRPHVPDAWVDPAKTKVGYEIPFTRHFYKYVPPRPLAEIDADLDRLASEIIELLREVES